MPGPIPRPKEMRDILYKQNWRTGLWCIPIAAVTWIIGGQWVLYKRRRYDQFFEKCTDPEFKRFVLDHTSLEPEKYSAFIKRMQAEMTEIKENPKYVH